MLRRTFRVMRSEPRHIQWGMPKKAVQNGSREAKALGYGGEVGIEFLCAKGVPNKTEDLPDGTSKKRFALIMNPPNDE